jgi:hypothetical protein
MALNGPQQRERQVESSHHLRCREPPHAGCVQQVSDVKRPAAIHMRADHAKPVSLTVYASRPCQAYASRPCQAYASRPCQASVTHRLTAVGVASATVEEASFAAANGAGAGRAGGCCYVGWQACRAVHPALAGQAAAARVSLHAQQKHAAQSLKFTAAVAELHADAGAQRLLSNTAWGFCPTQLGASVQQSLAQQGVKGLTAESGCITPGSSYGRPAAIMLQLQLFPGSPD